jgi:hypothetical protein
MSAFFWYAGGAEADLLSGGAPPPTEDVFPYIGAGYYPTILLLLLIFS